MIGKQDWIGLAKAFVAVPSAAAQTTTYTGTAIDALGCDDGQLCLSMFGTSTATALVTVQESDDGSTNWTTIAAPAVTLIANQLGSGLVIPIQAAQTMYQGNFQKSKRYLRVIVTGTGWTLAGMIQGENIYLGS